jgi:hypothetical protein
MNLSRKQSFVEFLPYSSNGLFIYNELKAQFTTCLRDLARHFKTEHSETLVFCFGIHENTVFSVKTRVTSNSVE